MTGDAKSVTEAVVLVAVIVLRDWVFDWLGFRSQIVAKILDPEPLELVKNGRMIKKNMDREMITEDELMSQLRQQGAEDISEVKSCCLESNGKFSVIKFDPETNEGNKNEGRPVH